MKRLAQVQQQADLLMAFRGYRPNDRSVVASARRRRVRGPVHSTKSSASSIPLSILVGKLRPQKRCAIRYSRSDAYLVILTVRCRSCCSRPSPLVSRRRAPGATCRTRAGCLSRARSTTPTSSNACRAAICGWSHCQPASPSSPLVKAISRTLLILRDFAAVSRLSGESCRTGRL
jgi:hypothetical protein